MAKKQFEIPFILLSGGIGGGGGVVIDDPSSGQGTPDHPYACEYNTWLAQFAEDLDHDDDTDFEDYRLWWIAHNYSAELWAQINPNNPLNP